MLQNGHIKIVYRAIGAVPAICESIEYFEFYEMLPEPCDLEHIKLVFKCKRLFCELAGVEEDPTEEEEP